jgi:hypothetical protein
MEVHSREHRLTHIAWRLWWEDGGKIPPPAREMMIRAARSWDEERNRLAALLAGDEAGVAGAVVEMDKLYADAENDRLRGPLAEARRNVGRERFATVVRVLAEVGAGRFAPRPEDRDPDGTAQLVERALGLERARTDKFVGATPRITGGLEIDLGTLTEILGSRPMVDLANTVDSELDLARAEIQSLIGVVTAVAPLLERLHGRGAFGLGMMGRLFGAPRAHSQVLMLLGWLALRTTDTLRAGFEQIAAMAPQAAAAAQLYGLISELRQEVAVLAPVLSDVRLAAAQLDESAAIALNTEIAQLREHHTESFDAFFAVHPEAERLISVIEAHQAASNRTVPAG